MKTIGMIGSVTWQATIEYYRIINETVGRKLGGHHSAKIVMACTDFEDLSGHARAKDWDGVAELITREGEKLEKAGADFFIVCANTLHKIAEDVLSKVRIPMLHIVEATAESIEKKGLKKVSLLGTRFTMEDGFYQRVMDKHGIDIMVPDEADRTFIHNSIFDEFSLGVFSDETRKAYLRIIDSQIAQGAEGVILGCTEIPLLIQQEHVSIPVFDTTRIHAEAAVTRALSEDKHQPSI